MHKQTFTEYVTFICYKCVVGYSTTGDFKLHMQHA